MDFSRVELSPEDQEFRDQFRAFLAEHVTDEVLRRDRESGENFSEPVHLALGEAGYLESDFKQEADGGFDPVRRRIFQLEIGRAHTPWFHWGTTAVVAKLMRQFGDPKLVDAVLPGVLSVRSGCAWATPSPRAAPTSRRARPAPCATVTDLAG
ncbi:acyl-CoA dehydrogenase [Mycobacterium shigaense]|uniref:Acyl-CoA dehydrogenase n=1 Tax=Mycobacterium shigaense TaxID=722731 RepID=A0A1Z4EC23_9MYCO|nr:acyl-CoA dehydrogenase [Mycobacterium shigaense]